MSFLYVSFGVIGRSFDKLNTPRILKFPLFFHSDETEMVLVKGKSENGSLTEYNGLGSLRKEYGTTVRYFLIKTNYRVDTSFL